jgi:hypothetical protein
MIAFDPDELLDGLDHLARNEGLVARLDREAMTLALAEASALAAGRPEHELAGLFYAFGRRAPHFGPAVRVFLRGLLRAHALANGLDLAMSDLEFAVQNAGIARGEVDFFELRAWFEARIRPLGNRSRRPPPRRSR